MPWRERISSNAAGRFRLAAAPWHTLARSGQRCLRSMLSSNPRRLLPAFEDSALRPSWLLWLLLTSPPLSRGIAGAVVRCERTKTEISSGKACLLLADPPDLPRSIPNDHRASPSLAGWPNTAMASYPVSVRRVRDFVIGFLRIPPCGGHPCLDGWFRSSRSMGDFHPLNASHTEHTRPKAYSTMLIGFWLVLRWSRPACRLKWLSVRGTRRCESRETAYLNGSTQWRPLPRLYTRGRNDR